MGRRLKRRRGGRLGWPAALLGATILSSCCLLTQAQAKIPVVTEPSELLEGENATLTPGGNPRYIVCYWYRGQQSEQHRIFTYIPFSPPEKQHGPKFTGRHAGVPGCSLHIRNLTLSDTGNYIVSKIVSPVSEVGHASIKVVARKPWDKGVIAGIVLGTLAGLALFGGLLYYSHRQYSRRMILKVSESSLLPPASAKKPTV